MAGRKQQLFKPFLSQLFVSVNPFKALLLLACHIHASDLKNIYMPFPPGFVIFNNYEFNALRA